MIYIKLWFIACIGVASATPFHSFAAKRRRATRIQTNDYGWPKANYWHKYFSASGVQGKAIEVLRLWWSKKRPALKPRLSNRRADHSDFFIGRRFSGWHRIIHKDICLLVSCRYVIVTSVHAEKKIHSRYTTLTGLRYLVCTIPHFLSTFTVSKVV